MEHQIRYLNKTFSVDIWILWKEIRFVSILTLQILMNVLGHVRGPIFLTNGFKKTFPHLNGSFRRIPAMWKKMYIYGPIVTVRVIQSFF